MGIQDNVFKKDKVGSTRSTQKPVHLLFFKCSSRLSLLLNSFLHFGHCIKSLLRTCISLIYSLTYELIYFFTYSLIYIFTYSLIHLFTYLLSYLLIYLFTDLLIYLFTYLLTCVHLIPNSEGEL